MLRLLRNYQKPVAKSKILKVLYLEDWLVDFGCLENILIL